MLKAVSGARTAMSVQSSLYTRFTLGVNAAQPPLRQLILERVSAMVSPALVHRVDTVLGKGSPVVGAPALIEGALPECACGKPFASV